MGVGGKYSRIRVIGKWGRGKCKGGKSILLFEGKWKAKFIENQIVGCSIVVLDSFLEATKVVIHGS